MSEGTPERPATETPRPAEGRWESLLPPKDDRWCKQETKELEACRDRYAAMRAKAEALPASGEKTLLLFNIHELETQALSLVKQKYVAIRDAWRLCESRVEIARRNLDATKDDILKMGFLDYRLGRNTQGMATYEAEEKVLRTVRKVQFRLIDYAKKGECSATTLANIGKDRDTVIGAQFDYSEADKAYGETIRKARSFEGHVRRVDDALAALSKGAPWGPEIYASMRAVGMKAGGAETPIVNDETVKQYAKARLGAIKGELANAAFQNPDELMAAYELAKQAKPYLTQAIPLVEEYLRETGVADALVDERLSAVGVNVTQLFLARRFPKLVAVTAVANDLVKGKDWQDAIGDNRRFIVRAGKSAGGAGGKAVADGSVILVGGAPLERLENKLKAIRLPGLSPEDQAQLQAFVVSTTAAVPPRSK